MNATSGELPGPGITQARAAQPFRITAALSYLMLLGGLLTVGLSLYIVITTCSSLPFWDGWTQVEVAANGRSPVSPSWLWQQHNEHRLVVPKLFLAFDLRLFRARQFFLLASIFVIQLLHLTLLSWSMRVLGGWSGALWRAGTGVAAFCLFCPTQAENFTWGFQVCFVLPPFFATLSFVALLLYWAETQQPDKQPSPWFLVLSILAATGAAYSLANGSLLWPLLAAAALYLRLRPRVILSFAAAGVISTALYLYHYVRPEGHANPLQSLAAPLTILKYCSAYFFSAWPYYDTGARLILPRLVLPMVVLMLLPAALPYLREFRPFAVQLILTILYCLGTAFITATGRLSFGISQATVSRYQTVALLFWCCLALLWLGGAFFAPSRMKYLFLVAQLCFLTVFAIGATRAKGQIWIMRGHAFALKTATAALLTGVADPDSLGQAYPEKGMFRRVVPYMKANRLSVFSGGLSSTMGKPLRSVFSLTDPSECAGALQTVFPLDNSFGPGLGPGLRVLGWAWDSKHQRLPSAIAVTMDDNVVGVGATGNWRPPHSDGFVAFSPPLSPQSTATFYAILDTSPPSACYIGRLFVK